MAEVVTVGCMDFEARLLLSLVAKNSPMAVAVLTWLVHGPQAITHSDDVDWVMFNPPLEL